MCSRTEEITQHLFRGLSFTFIIILAFPFNLDKSRYIFDVTRVFKQYWEEAFSTLPPSGTSIHTHIFTLLHFFFMWELHRFYSNIYILKPKVFFLVFIAQFDKLLALRLLLCDVAWSENQRGFLTDVRYTAVVLRSCFSSVLEKLKVFLLKKREL